jgi:hypothetical protein
MSIQPADSQQAAAIQPADAQQPATIHPADAQHAPARPRLAGVPHAEQQGAAARLRRCLGRLLRGRRIHQRLALLALAIEQLLIGATRTPDTTSYTENVILGIGKTAGDRVLARFHRILTRLAQRSDRLRGAQQGMRIRARYRDTDMVRHPDGGVRTVAQTASDQDQQRAQIEADRARGSFRHRRLPATLRRVPALVFGADGLLLLYFFSGVTNVDWASPFSAALVFALLLASMVTGISFAFFRFTGDRLQQYKDDAGVIPLRGLDEATTVSMALALGAIIVLAALMFIRMRAEVLSTLGPASGGTAIIISSALAMVSILANTLAIAVHALDGSAEADRLEALGQAVTPQLALQQHLLERAEALNPAIDVIGREAERIAFDGRTAAGHELAAADQVIAAGRAANQGTGPISEPAINPNDEQTVIGYRRTDASPQVDERPVRLALDHVHTPLPSAQPEQDQAAS